IWTRGGGTSRCSGVAVDVGCPTLSNFVTAVGARAGSRGQAEARNGSGLGWELTAAEMDPVLLRLAQRALGQAAQLGGLAALGDAAAALGGLLLDLERQVGRGGQGGGEPEVEGP